MNFMAETDGQIIDGLQDGFDGEVDQTLHSNFRLVILAALRSKQLLNGSKPRIEVDPLRRRSTSIAVEEVKRGLVPFRLLSPEQVLNGKAMQKMDKPWGNARV
jgi:DNA-directed RNA polymerase omega subunit